jgi:RNA polymerase sigma factor (sigma-70 family)
MPSPTTVLLRTQSDERLVALARAGHERAFEAIVERYRKPLVRACRRVLPEARAEDAVQQALVAAWTALVRGDAVRELRPWLYRIAHNTALNQLRLAGYDHDELHNLLDTGPAPEEELERREVARRTLTGLAALPPRQREALLQTAVQGRGQEEVARTLGVSEPAVRQLVHRARTQLRAAATALTPMPLAGWLADLGVRAAPMADRIGDVAAGGGAAGLAATVAKVGAVIVLAGGAAASGPGVVERVTHGGGGARALGAAAAKAAEPVRAIPAAATPEEPVALVAPQAPVAAPRRRGGDGTVRGGDARSGPRSRREDDQRRSGEDSSGEGSSGRDGSDRRSGSSGDDGGRSADDTVSGTSGSGSSGDGLSGGSGSSGGDGLSGGSGTSGGDDGGTATSGGGSASSEPTSSDGGSSSSGPGPGDDGTIPAVTPTATPTSGSSHGDGGRDDAIVDPSAD